MTFSKRAVPCSQPMNREISARKKIRAIV